MWFFKFPFFGHLLPTRYVVRLRLRYRSSFVLVTIVSSQRRNSSRETKAHDFGGGMVSGNGTDV